MLDEMRYVIFSVGGHQYGIEIEKVMFIIAREQTETVSPSIIRVGGKTFPLCDICSILGTKPKEAGKTLIAVTSRNGDTAFAVEKIDGLFSVLVDKIKPYRSITERANVLVSSIALL